MNIECWILLTQSELKKGLKNKKKHFVSSQNLHENGNAAVEEFLHEKISPERKKVRSTLEICFRKVF